MEKSPAISNSFGLSFLGVQTAILALGLGLVYFFKIPIHWSANGNQVALALIFSLPMIVLAILLTSPVGLGIDFVRTIFERITDSPMGPFIQNGPIWALALMSLLAGVGEELVFRGFLQIKVGLIIAAVLFGLCHFVSFAFFAIATFFGIYLGSIYIWSDYNLCSPIIIHALYDFVALLLMRRALR